MGSIFEYVLWRGHDCDGTMPALDVLAGVLAASAPTLADDEVMVVVPPQWLGDLAEGGRLPPGFQQFWAGSPDPPHPPPPPPTRPPNPPPPPPARRHGSTT